MVQLFLSLGRSRREVLSSLQRRTRQACFSSNVDYLTEILNAVRVYEVAKETPLVRAPMLSERLACEVLVKREDMQPVFSFKIRGAYNKIAQLTASERAAGVVACSAGNHAQGVALSCKSLGLRGVIVMPKGTPRIKVDAVRSHGGRNVEVKLHGDAYDDAAAEANRLVREEGLTLIHPFNDPAVIAGQGTIGLEILRQRSGKRLDAIFCCVGGGGLLAGVASYVKRVRPEVKVYGVEAIDAAGMTASLQSGSRVDLDHVGLFADGAAVRSVGDETYRICSELVDGMVTVNNDEICAAIKAGFQDARCVLEPAGALALAGMRKHLESIPRSSNSSSSLAESATSRDREEATPTYVAIASGANMDFDRLRFVSENADRSEVRLSLRIPERPGAFRELYTKIYPCNVTEFSYRFHRADRPADIILTFQPQTNVWYKRLSDAGYEPRDITGDELTKSHLRHLSGGRAPDNGMTERLFRFEFPEAPGALNRFLERLDAATANSDPTAKFNCSLFHYRNYGHDFGRVLVALQLPPSQPASTMDAFLSDLGYRYFEETNNPTYLQFLAPESTF